MKRHFIRKCLIFLTEGQKFGELGKLCSRWRGALLLMVACGYACSFPASVRSLFVDPLSPEKGGISFVAFGDQGTGRIYQKKVSQQLMAFCHQRKCDFAVLLGDNFYFRGVKDINDPMFKRAFEEPYGGLNNVFYPTLGNHDHLGNIQAQINYSRVNPRWHMPDRNYSHVHPKGTEKPLVEFFVIDSENFTQDDEAWLKQALNLSKATWKILSLHHPLISNGRHGDDSARIARRLVPLICGKIDLILSGHDHSKEHLVGRLHGCELNQIVLGTGGAFLHNISPDSRTRYAVKSFGFGWFQVNPTEIYFEFVNEKGLVEYTAVVKQ